MDLQLSDVFEADPSGGSFTFAGERVVLMDAVALGLLRAQLVQSFGLAGARGILARFGFSHGWRTADTMRGAIGWDDEREWRVAGGRLHRLYGMVSFEPVADAQPGAFAEGVWPDSFEAEQHLLHLGQADSCVCWMSVGFASGYLSRANGRTLYAREVQCRAKGDPVCRVVARFKEDWPPELDAEFTFYENECLTEGLKELQQALRRVDRRLAARRAGAPVTAADGGNEAMARVLGQARRVAAVDASVLILGESGSGKERIARLIHEQSPRQGGPFVAINCAAMPEALLESELFGHVRGAFTGAAADRIGLFEAARGGTLLLDEVGELPLPMQAKLLRVLQEREVRRLGENRTRAIDVRVIAATHRDLAAEVRAGRFREDLYFRLRVVELKVPPLRERREDVLALAGVALAEAAARTRTPVKRLSQRAARAVLAYRWPGNVRELFNAMERAHVMAVGPAVDPEDLPEEVAAPGILPASAPAGTALADVERDHILRTLAATGGNRARAALALKIGQATLFRKLKAYQEQGFAVAPAA